MIFRYRFYVFFHQIIEKRRRFPTIRNKPTASDYPFVRIEVERALHVRGKNGDLDLNNPESLGDLPYFLMNSVF